MTVKHELKKQKIIDTAFKVWGEEYFYKTSLAPVAREMGMSKAGLYRYFSGKDELIAAMVAELMRIHQRVCDGVRVEEGRTSFEERLEKYHEGFLRFYAENSRYYRFAFLYLLPHSAEDLLEHGKLEELQAGLFPLEMLEEEFHWSGELAEVVRRFLFSVGMYLLHNRHFDQKQDLRLTEMIRVHRTLVSQGFAGQKCESVIDFSAIERHCAVRPEELMEPEPVFRAVAEVVAEEGLWEASLEKIARRAGMSKSSLYFYFSNRNDMLWQIIDRERRGLGEIFLERTGGMESFEDRLYGYFVVFYSYLQQRQNFLSVMNWFRFQRFHIKPPSHMNEGLERYMGFIGEGLTDHRLRRDLMEPSRIILWVNFLLVQEINQEFCTGSRADASWDVVRGLYKLFLFGVGGSHGKK